MKKVYTLALSIFLLTAGNAFAEDKVKVLQCPMDAHTVEINCPECGMKMEEKELTAADAQAAIDKTKEKMRNRSN